MFFLYIQVVWPFFAYKKRRPEGLLLKLSYKVNDYFTMNFWVSEPALTK